MDGQTPEGAGQEEQAVAPDGVMVRRSRRRREVAPVRFQHSLWSEGTERLLPRSACACVRACAEGLL